MSGDPLTGMFGMLSGGGAQHNICQFPGCQTFAHVRLAIDSEAFHYVCKTHRTWWREQSYCTIRQVAWQPRRTATFTAWEPEVA